MATTAHSKNFDKVKKYYNTFKSDGTRMWTEDMVKNAVVKGWVTSVEYEEIVGEHYQE